MAAALSAAIPGLPSVPGIPGLSAPSVAAPSVTPAAATTAAPATPFQQFLTGGIRMEKMTLILLTLFPATGLAGLNLQAVQNTTGALLKVASYLVSSLYAIRLMRVYPGILTKVLSAFLFLGPWFVFDCMEILVKPDFPKEGFRPPIPITGYPPATPTDGSWTLTPTLVSLIGALLPAYALGSTGILNSFFPGLVGGDIQKYMGYAVGGTAVLGAGFAMFAANKAPAPAALSAAPAAFVPQAAPQMGGGKPLSAFAKEMMRSASPQAFQESKAFLGILGFVIAGGIALGVARNGIAGAGVASA
jgi:hypothetical protein